MSVGASSVSVLNLAVSVPKNQYVKCKGPASPRSDEECPVWVFSQLPAGAEPAGWAPQGSRALPGCGGTRGLPKPQEASAHQAFPMGSPVEERHRILLLGLPVVCQTPCPGAREVQKQETGGFAGANGRSVAGLHLYQQATARRPNLAPKI